MVFSHNDDQYETEDSDEYSDDDEEEEVQLKPIFIPKSNRVTIKEQEIKVQAEEQLLLQKNNKIESRKIQTRVLVADSLRKIEELKELQAAENVDSDAGLPDDTDDIDDEMEYEAWKVREMSRLKREAEEREAIALEAAEVLRRRNMTDEERLEEDRKLGRITEEGMKEEKPKWKFLQKYYHKGVFYMDSSSMKDPNDVRSKDYAAEPTLEDKIDKEKLPEVLRVKNFGKRGRTKYTHLLDQDTTIDKQSKKRIDVKADKKIESLYENKRSGVKKIL